MRIILASGSPRRRELLTQIGLPFEVIVSRVEEHITETMPGKVVEELSRQKALDVFTAVCEKEESGKTQEQKERLLVIGADTVVACDGRILGKPASGEEAAAMLRSLSGREHQVYTGVTLCMSLQAGTADSRELSCAEETVRIVTFHEETKVRFYPMTQEEIASYVESRDPLDKAGAYGIQGLCARYINGIEGDYNNVVGLPVGRLYQELKKLCPAALCTKIRNED